MFEGTIFEQPPPRNDPTVARIATNTQQMGMDFRQLSEQMSALNRNLETLDARVTRLEAQANAAPRSPGSQDDIVALRRDVQLIRTERETLKREITDDLAGRIEKIAARQQAEINAARGASSAASGSGRGASATSARPAAGASAAPGDAKRSGYEHKVERGQTLSEIARGYGKSLDAIMKANKITNPSSIRVGQVLFIPD